MILSIHLLYPTILIQLQSTKTLELQKQFKH